MVVLKAIVSLFLFASLFAIMVPPRLFGANGRKKAIAAALVWCVLLIVMKEGPKQAVTEATVAQETPKPQSTTSSSQIPVQSPSKPASERITDLREGLVGGERVEIIRVSAMNLFREYERNEVATDMRLKGSIVEISGKVVGVSKDFLDSAYVQLRTPNEFMSASVRPIQSDIDKVARLRKGQIVTFRCENMGRFFGAPSGKKCVLID